MNHLISVFTSRKRSSSDQQDKDIRESLDKTEYPILLYEPNFDSFDKEINKEITEIQIPIEDNSSISIFSQFQEAFEFAQTLGTGFLLITSNEVEEEKILKDFEALKDTYGRRYFDFEERKLFLSLSKGISEEIIKSLKAFVFFTRQDFNHEAPICEEEEEVMIMSDAKDVASQFRQDFTIFWCDPNFSPETKEIFQKEFDIPEKNIYTTLEDLLKIIESYMEVPYYLILSGETQTDLIESRIGDLEDLLCLYLYPGSDLFLEREKSEKIKIEKTPEELILQIKKDIQANSKFKGKLPTFATNFDDWDKSHINKMHYYLRGFTSFQNRKQAKSDFFNLAKRIYHSQKLISFELEYLEYDREQILKWYLENLPIFQLTNNCLRIATSDSILYCRFILKDLEMAIREEYHQRSKNYNGVVYRAGSCSSTEWDKLQSNIGQEIEMYGFLSTSKNLKTAKRFFWGDTSNRALITIIIPPLPSPASDEQGFACLDQYSHFPNEEILFNVRSRFQVLNVETVSLPQKNKPQRFLVLMYGAELLRKSLTIENPVICLKLELPFKFNCNHCKLKINLFAYKTETGETQIICRKCFLTNDFASNIMLFLPIDEKVKLNEERSINLDIKGKVLEFGVATKLIYENSFRCDQCLKSGQDRFYKWVKLENQTIIRECLECFEENQENRSDHLLLSEKETCVFWNTHQREWEKVDSEFKTKEFQGFEGCYEAAIFYKTQEYQKCEEFCKKSLQNLTRKRNKEQEKMASLEYLAESTQWIGDYQKALEFSMKILSIRKFIYGENHKETAASYNNLGTIFHALGSYQKALESHTQALDIRKSIYGEDHPDVAVSYNNLAAINESLGKYQKALELDLSALEIEKSLFGETHPNTATSYNNLGMIFHNLGDHQKALEYLIKALDIRKHIYGRIHPDTASSHNNLAIVHSSLGEYKQALEYHLEALNIRIKIYGKTHPNVATSYNNLALVYSELESFEKALEYELKALQIRVSSYGEAHPSIATSYNNIGSAYSKLGEYQKALEYYSKASNIQTYFSGHAHPAVAITYNNLGTVYHALEDEKKALNYILKAVDIQRSVFGESHPEIANSYHNLAKVYQTLGEYQKAYLLYLNALKIRESIYGERHSLTVNSYISLAQICGKQREYHKALDYRKKILDFQKDTFGESHPETANSYHNLAKVYYHLKEHQKALEYHLKALNIWKLSIGKSDLEIANSYHNLAKVYQTLGEHQTALSFHRKALEIRENTFGETHPMTARSYQILAKAYYNVENHQEGLKYYLKAMNILRSDVPSDNNIATLQRKQQTLQQIFETNQETSGGDDPVKRSGRLSDIEKTEYSKSNSTCDPSDFLLEDEQETEYESKNQQFGSVKFISKNEHSEISSLSFSNPRYKLVSMKEEQNSIKNKFAIPSFKQLDDAGKEFEIASVNRELAFESEKSGDYEKAIEYHQKALSQIKSTNEERNPEIYTSYSHLASIYNILENYQKAAEYLLKALDIKKSINEQDVETSADLYNNLGLVYESLEDYKTALEFHLKALEIRESIFERKDHSDLADSYDNIASVYENLGDLPKALEFYSKALNVQNSISDKNPPDLASLYRNLGTVYQKLGEFKKALKCQQKAIQILKTCNQESNLPTGEMCLDPIDWPGSGEYPTSEGFLVQPILIDKHYKCNI